MDPAHDTTQDDEYFLQGMIHENEDIDVTRTFLNNSGEEMNLSTEETAPVR
jgi:hypothetical protein